MSFESMEGQCCDIVDVILAKIGVMIERVEQNVVVKILDFVMRKFMGVCMVLEYVVLVIVCEKNMVIEVVVMVFKGVIVVQQMVMFKEGLVVFGWVYCVEFEVLVNVFVGCFNEVEMFKGFGSMLEIDKMVDICCNLVMSIVKDEYVNCGCFEGGGSGKSDSFIVLKFEGIVVLVKIELVVCLVFMELSIDVVVGKGVISQVNVDMLKEWIEV